MWASTTRWPYCSFHSLSSQLGEYLENSLPTVICLPNHISYLLLSLLPRASINFHRILLAVTTKYVQGLVAKHMRYLF